MVEGRRLSRAHVGVGTALHGQASCEVREMVRRDEVGYLSIWIESQGNACQQPNTELPPTCVNLGSVTARQSQWTGLANATLVLYEYTL